MYDADDDSLLKHCVGAVFCALIAEIVLMSFVIVVVEDIVPDLS